MPRSRAENHGAEESITSGTGPAYAVAGYGAADTNGVHCSAFDEFCFFCTYQKNSDAVGNSEADLYGNLVEMADNLTKLRREPSAIAHHISAAYKSTVQHYVPDNPSWSVASILRHLLYGALHFRIAGCYSVFMLITTPVFFILLLKGTATRSLRCLRTE